MNPQNSPTLFAAAGSTDTGAGGTASSGAIAETKTKIAQSARDAASKVKSAASSTATKAREEAEKIVTDKREMAADRIGGYSAAIHDSAKALEEKDPNIAWFTHRAADKLQSVADYVRSRDFNALRNDCQDVARRHPAVFFGGLFLTGLVLGNVLKASRRKLDESEGGMTTDSDMQLTSPGSMGMGSSYGGGESVMQPDLTASERGAAGI